MTGPLADPMAARDHARAMAGTVVETTTILPPMSRPKTRYGRRGSRRLCDPRACVHLRRPTSFTNE